jgi:cell division protein WhiA
LSAPGFTDRLRAELAHFAVGPPCCRRAELAGALRFGGTFRRQGGDGAGFGLVLESATGAVVRRLHQVLRDDVGVRPELAVAEAGALRPGPTYRLALPAAAQPALRSLELFDAAGRPRSDVPAALTWRRCDRAAYLRGVLLAAGSVSGPRQAAHLEVRTASGELAAGLAALLRAAGAAGARHGRHRDAWRAVAKDGAEIADVLAAVGAHSAFLAFDEGRLRRELRGAANRAANADRANLGRAVAASGRQAAVIERVVAEVGWDALDADLRAVALARIANPEATLAELGALLDPPLGKSAVHRRLQRLCALAAGEDEADAPA